MGYTYIVPVSAEILLKYKKSEIGKNDIKKEMIATKSPYALLVMDLVYPPFKKSRFKPDKKISGNLVLEAMAHHIDIYFKALPQKAKIKICIQDDKNSVGTFFRKHSEEEFKKCKDGHDLITFYFYNRRERKFMTNFVLPKKYILLPKDEPPTIKPMNDKGQFCFATNHDIEEISKMNVEAFKGSRWTGKDDLNDLVNYKTERNISHLNKNHLTILGIYSEDQKTLLGFTHILPVKKNTWLKYRYGKIEDIDFSSKNIEPAYKKEPFGLIIFTVALGEKRVNKIMGEKRAHKASYSEYRRACGELLEKALAYHLGDLFKQQFEQSAFVNVLLKNWDNSIKEHFKDCNHKTLYKDDFTDELGMTFLRIKNPYYDN